MTLVVGFNFGPYALLGSDTRVTYFLPTGPRHRDDEIKLVRTSLGAAGRKPSIGFFPLFGLTDLGPTSPPKLIAHVVSVPGRS
jgi:hypothetical protein